jgi:scyllo-inosamine-4-phosphate amidinotransferase 1
METNNMTYSTNEWDALQKVIVGTATGARVPEIDISVRCVNYADLIDDINLPKAGMYPQQVIDEANQDLEIFCNFLSSLGVEVLRPHQHTDVQYYDYCPRDLIFLHGKDAIATPCSLIPRHTNYKNIQSYFDHLTVTPRYSSADLYNQSCIGDPNQLALTEYAPSFDAANIIRANDHVLYLNRNSGNKSGARYLQDVLGSSVKVHVLEGVYSYMHIDSTIAFLREGLMLLNPSRIKDLSVLPTPFRSWDVIWCPDPTDIGHYPGYNHASIWINMNLFSVNEHLVVLEENQHSLRKQLQKYGIECEMLPMRHQRTLGGGFHCVTLDINRCGK